MKRTLIFTIAIASMLFSGIVKAHNCGNFFHFKAIDWLSEQKEISEFFNSETEDIELNQVLQTRFCPAVESLKKESLVLLEPRFIPYYLGDKYKPVKGKNAYLLRGVINNFTGNSQAFLNRNNNTIAISFSSLGANSKNGAEFFPVVIFLKNKPSRVLVTTSGAS